MRRVLLCFLTVLTSRQVNGFSTAGVAHRSSTAACKVPEKRKLEESFGNVILRIRTNIEHHSMMAAASPKDAEKEENNGNFLSVGYTCLSLANLAQVLMAVHKSGLTLMCANIAGGPVLAGGIAWILSKGSLNDDDASSKLMNGSLMLYSSLCLFLVGLVPQLDNLFGLLYMLTGASTFMVAGKGYSKDFTNSGFVKETKNILPQIHRANMYAFPKDWPNLLYMVCMVTVIILKTNIFLQLTELTDPSISLRRIIASKVSLLAKLTLLGGSLVTLRDAANQKLLGQTRFRKLNLLAAYIFGSMAALELFQASVSHQISISFLLLMSAVSCARNAFFV